MKTRRLIITVAMAALVQSLCQGAVPVDTRSSAQKITTARVFTQPITWTGDQQPGESQSLALSVAVDSFKTAGPREGVAALEAFIATNPESPWTPSLRAQLGKYYLDKGYFTRALDHWEKAWNGAKDSNTKGGRMAADFALAHYSRLLGSLGRRQELATLFAETKGRVLVDPVLNNRFNATKEGYARMIAEPTIAYRCGTFALDNVGKTLKGTNYLFNFGPTRKSPDTGFSVDALFKMSNEAKLDLIPVQRKGNAELVVPSVVHWKQEHYAAIVGQDGDYYKVIDPTFGQPHWFSRQAIDEESSGYFMIPRSSYNSQGWDLVGAPKTQAVKGKGYFTIFTYEYDCNGVLQYVGAQSFMGTPSNPGWSGPPGGPPGGCGKLCRVPPSGFAPMMHGLPNPSSPGTCSSCGGGGASGLAGQRVTYTTGEHGVTPPPDPLGLAMAIWGVSQPYTSLWITDTPYVYQSPVNGQMYLRLEYKQGQTRPVNTNVFGFGPLWHGNVTTYLKVTDTQEDPDYQYYQATVYSSDGSERQYLYDDTGYESLSRTKMERIDDGFGGLAGFKLIYPGGSEGVFTYFHTNGLGELEVFLTEDNAVTGKGGITLNYETTTNDVVRLMTLVDASGLTNTFSYDTNLTHLITEIESPYGDSATFAYDGSGNLTSITDVVGITSSFAYDTNSWVTNLTTPYGTTTFAYTNESAVIDCQKSITVTQPNGGTHLYTYRYFHGDESQVNDPNGDPFTVNENEWVMVQYSSHFGPLQYLRLSTNNPKYFSAADRRLGSHTFWSSSSSGEFGGQPGVYLDGKVILTLDVSPDSAADGKKTFFTYDSGQSAPKRIWYLLPNGTTNYVEYIRSDKGYPTNIISTWEKSDGSLSTRTNKTIYAANGIDVAQIVGPGGHTEAAFGYNSDHQVTSMTNAVGDVTTYTYDANGRLTSSTTPAGLTTTNLYDGNGFLIQTIDIEIGRTNTFTHSQGRIYSHLNECGLNITNTWDALGRLASVIYPDGTSISNLYDKLDVVGRKDRLGNWTLTTYNSMQQPTAVTDALTNTTRYAHCVCGAMEYVTNALGNVTTFFYDNAGNQTSVLLSDASVSSRSYNKLGQLVSVTDALNRSTTNYYNNQGLVTTVSNALGRVSLRQYDIEDHATNTVDANGIGIVTTFDELGRPLTRTYPDAGVEKFGFGAKGLLAYTNQLNKVTRYGYDAAGRKTAETNANNEVILYTYSPSGELLTLTDGKVQTTTWQYDEYCRQTNKLDATSASVFQYKYDANGRLTNRWTPAKGHTYYTYNAVGGLTNVDYATSTDIRMKYDALGRMTNMVDAAGTTDYAFDTVGRLLSEDGPWVDDTVSYGYHTNGQRASLSVALPSLGGLPWTQVYGYDVVNRMTNITSFAGIFTYQYETTVGANSTPVSSLVYKTLLPGGSEIVNTHDGIGRLVSTALKNASSTTLNQHSYIYNVGNQRTKQTFTDGNYTDYVYDDIGQLNTALGSESGGSSRLHEQMGYTYDAAGNLNYRTNNALVQSFTVDSLNQISNATRSGTLTVAGRVGQGVPPVSVTVNGNAASLYADQMFAKAGFSLVDGTNSFTAIATDATPSSVTNNISTWLPATAAFQYDGNGNLLSDGRRGMTWNDENQLVQVVITNKVKSEFTYDGKHRLRTSKDYEWNGSGWTLTNEVRRVYDGFLVMQERNGDNQPTKTYTRGRDLSGSFEGVGGIGGLLALSRHQGTGQPTLHASYHADGNGNITALVNAQGALVAEHTYDPYGRETGNSGAWASFNSYRFSSKEWHTPSGLLSYIYRWYEPDLQRWLNRDPLQEQGGLNLYNFVNNNAVSLFDPLGLDAQTCFAGCLASGKASVIALAARLASSYASGYGIGILIAITGGGIALIPGGQIIGASILVGGLLIDLVSYMMMRNDFNKGVAAINADYAKCLNQCKQRYPGCAAEALAFYTQNPLMKP